MLAEFLADRRSWAQVMPGARACLFSLEGRPFSLPLQLSPLHFEVLFCLSGAVTLTRRNGTMLTVSARQVLLLTDLSGLAEVRVDTPLEGILVAVNARGAKESLKTICGLLGGLSLDTRQVRQWMANQGGCAVEGPSDWSRAAFGNLNRLPRSEQTRWCVWKSVELLYLLCNPEGQPDDTVPILDRKVARTLAETLQYMESHLDETLTIQMLSRRACLSATAFKECFRRLCGVPVHTWLRQRRMECAAELLRGSSLTVLEVAQSVGYSSSGQFSAAFRRQHGMSPTMYRKMSEPA